MFGCVSRRPSDLCCALYPVPTPTLHTHQHQSSQLQRTMVHPPVGISQRGHQPTWGQVSFIFAQHTAHLRFSVLFCSRPGACLIKKVPLTNIACTPHVRLLSFSFTDLGGRSLAATTKGHQQIWGQVSPCSKVHSTHIRFVSFADSGGCSSSFFRRFGRTIRTKGHQQTWGLVSFVRFFRGTHLRLVFYVGSERRVAAERRRRAASRPGAR